jgi:hypothetical protein
MIQQDASTQPNNIGGGSKTAELADGQKGKEEKKAILAKGTVKLQADKYLTKAPSNKGMQNGNRE